MFFSNPSTKSQEVFSEIYFIKGITEKWIFLPRDFTFSPNSNHISENNLLSDKRYKKNQVKNFV